MNSRSSIKTQGRSRISIVYAQYSVLRQFINLVWMLKNLKGLLVGDRTMEASDIDRSASIINIAALSCILSMDSSSIREDAFYN